MACSVIKSILITPFFLKVLFFLQIIGITWKSNISLASWLDINNSNWAWEKNQKGYFYVKVHAKSALHYPRHCHAQSIPGHPVN